MPPYGLLPLRSSEPSTQSYLQTKLRSYELNLENECFEDAYVNAHLIFIYWLYLKLWVVVTSNPKLADQIFALHSFDSKFDRAKFLKTTSALEMHQLKLEEKKYAEVFGALCLERSDVKLLKELVMMRNNILHPSGSVQIQSGEDLEMALRTQQLLAKNIARSLAPVYLDLVLVDYGKVTYRKILRWENDQNLEQYLFTKYQLSEIDFIIIKGFLHTR